MREGILPARLAASLVVYLDGLSNSLFEQLWKENTMQLNTKLKYGYIVGKHLLWTVLELKYDSVRTGLHYVVMTGLVVGRC